MSDRSELLIIGAAIALVTLNVAVQGFRWLGWL